MKQKFKIIIPAIVVVITAVICVLMIVNNKSKEAIKEITTTTNTAEVKTTIEDIISKASETTTIETNNLEPTNSENENTKLDTTNTSSKPSNNSSNNSLNKTTTKIHTTKPVTTKVTTTEPKITESSKDKFPIGHIIYSHPDGTSYDGDYWVGVDGSYTWKTYSNEIDPTIGGHREDGWNECTYNYGYTANPNAIKYIEDAISLQKPSKNGTYDGQTHNFYFWIWLP